MTEINSNEVMLQSDIDAVGARPLLDKLGEVSPHTLAHSLRLGHVALEVGLPDFALPAALHDNGKLDRTVLTVVENGSSSLNQQQKARIHRHTIYGRRNIQALDTPADMRAQAEMAQFVARHHHDSVGKLQKLAEQHPELAESVDATLWVKIADVFDAMRDNNRGYREQAPVEVAAEWALKDMGDVVILGKTAESRLKDIESVHIPPEKSDKFDLAA